MITLGRNITSNAEASLRREWLITNGKGGYAAGTLSLARSRVYHNLLNVSLVPPLKRHTLLASIDTWLELDGHRVPIITHEWATGVVLPDGYRNLESFELDGTLPIWNWVHNDIQIQQRVWMEHGKNTTYITYEYVRGKPAIDLRCKPLVTYRDHHHVTKGGATVNLTPITWEQGQGVDILVAENVGKDAEEDKLAPMPFRILTNGQRMTLDGSWWWSFHLAVENYRGLDDKEDLYQAGQIDHRLKPGDTLVIIVTQEDSPPLAWQESLRLEQARQADLIRQSELTDAPTWIQQLVLAADQFIVDRKFDDQVGKSVIAGYPWFSDWGRDTMIALPGLALATRRYDVAASVLRTFSRYVDQGMLPNRFPDEGGAPEYNTVDATLWYFVAIYLYLQANPDDKALAKELYPVLLDIIKWHRKGTRFNIHEDKDDNLLYQGEPSIQLTWMDVKVEDWVVTPRQGKAVEINALWYNALRIMAWLADFLGEKDVFTKPADKVLKSFRNRFWSTNKDYCYDVVDTPDGDDSTLRPNQLFAISLPFQLLEGQQAQQVVDVCARHLVGSHGLRSLSPDHSDYIGTYGGDIKSRDGAYHQGTMWAWLMGAFATAHYRAYGDVAAALNYLQPLQYQLLDGCVGSIAEVFDGDAPHAPHGAFAQAWSVAEVLRVYRELSGD